MHPDDGGNCLLLTRTDEYDYLLSNGPSGGHIMLVCRYARGRYDALLGWVPLLVPVTRTRTVVLP